MSHSISLNVLLPSYNTPLPLGIKQLESASNVRFITEAKNDYISSAKTEHKLYLYVEIYNKSDWDVRLRNDYFEVALSFLNLYIKRDIFCAQFKGLNYEDNSYLNLKPRSTNIFHTLGQYSIDSLEGEIYEFLRIKLNSINKLIRFVPFTSFYCIVQNASGQKFNLKLNKQITKIFKNNLCHLAKKSKF